MKLTVTEQAAKLYIEEVPLKKGEHLRLYVRVGGVGSGGFSVGVMKDVPNERSYKQIIDGVTFFVNEDDFWYFDGMTIDFNPDTVFLHVDHPEFTNTDHPNRKK
ncbi:iron-sulfur cluster biosynthesis family protein [Halalkalibacterium halodurans]|uniref:Core domain-containing protein n=1 Tax=Halalkalibacterium halodurans TaxID=86665 RepID=A0A0M0KK83_ALKHA|nr:iron-sulfur cluster biosynthesis family protein [Halalkalibacterium halodurans]TPE68794.1 hypothetical protein AMD02_011545 [Halalkalibacterium halodurans]